MTDMSYWPERMKDQYPDEASIPVELHQRLLSALDWAATFKLAGGEREFAILAEQLRLHSAHNTRVGD